MKTKKKCEDFCALEEMKEEKEALVLLGDLEWLCRFSGEDLIRAYILRRV
jgi:hypothetical protein